MKRMPFFLSFFVVASAALAPPGGAQQSVVGAVPTPLSPVGVTNGVAMTGQGGGGTLIVGPVVGGAEQDIFTNNAATPTNGALAVSTDVASQSNIVFNVTSNVDGAIGTTPPGGQFFLNISTFGAAGSAVNFQGNVFGTTLNVNGTGAVNFNSGTVNAFTNVIFNADGTVALAPNTTVTPGAVTTTAGTDTGTLVLGGGSNMAGAVGAAAASLKAITVAGGSNAAGVTASIGGAVFGYTFNLGTNTLIINGALTIADNGPAGVINTTIASPTVFGNIRPTGATNLGPLTVNVTVPAGAVILPGTNFNIIQTAPGGQSGTNGIIVTATDAGNPLYTFAQVPLTGTTNGLVEITIVCTPLNCAAGPLAPPVVAPLVPILIALAPNLPPNSTLVTTVAAINNLTTPGGVANALAQLAPSTPALSAPLVTFEGTREFQDLWLARLNDVMCGETSQPRRPEDESSTCRVNQPRSGWWLKGFGYFGNQGPTGAFPGYDSRIFGGTVGFDAPLESDEALGSETRVGVGVGYSRSYIDGKQFFANAHSDTYEATAYVDHEQGPWFVQGDVSFGWNEYSGTRNIVFPGVNLTANSGYSGQSYTAFATTGYHFYPAGGFTITPLASLQVTHMTLDGYTETGAGDVDLGVNSQSYDFVESGLGVKAARPFATADGTYVPEVHFKWLHELANPALQNTAAFAPAGSATFTTPGLRTSDETYDLGGGITFLSCSCSAETWSLEAVYDYHWRTDNYSAHQGMIRLSARF